jgi:hypothetical protein
VLQESLRREERDRRARPAAVEAADAELRGLVDLAGRADRLVEDLLAAPAAPGRVAG